MLVFWREGKSEKDASDPRDRIVLPDSGKAIGPTECTTSSVNEFSFSDL